MVVIDGEHYPSVNEAAFGRVRKGGAEIAGAVLAGGREKLPAGGLEEVAGVTVRHGPHAARVLAEALDDLVPDAVLDLSDDPVLDYRRRHELASVALHKGIRYEGAGFSFDPPGRPRLCSKPSLAIIGTGKRTGKTAVSGFAARSLAATGWEPVVVAMGRGGPPEPQVIDPSSAPFDPRTLVGMADTGRHAASDYIEDAVLAHVPTIGCWRCGSGLAGGVEFSNVELGVSLANDLPGRLLLLEGSGSAIPPVHADATCLVLPATVEIEYLRGYFGPYRLLLSDVVLVTMCEKPFASPSQISSIVRHIREVFRGLGDRGDLQGEIRVAATVLRPASSDPLEGASVFVATTAPEAAGEQLKSYLESHEKCRVVGISHSLSNRSQLERELQPMKGADVLLCEIKAAGVDVAIRRALDVGIRVAYMDNVPQSIDGEDLRALFTSSAELAASRFAETS
ncbi:MAG: cyclic 2,3-diphosphoglycerate synthase [Actinomycetota bacterium]|nr:cyclic 2,3-diphosphoglycerate synthase [Actinomycetota bacterium]